MKSKLTLRRKVFITIRLISISVITALALFVVVVLVWINFSPWNASDRALIIITESNGQLIPEDVKFYTDHKRLIDFYLTTFLGIKKTDLENKDILTVLDTSGDIGLAKLIKKFTKGYGKVIILTENDASFDKFLETLERNKGRSIDIITFMHGSPQGFMYFKSEFVSPQEISDLVKGNNIGYVYQVNCYGEMASQAWLKSGAKTVSGSKDINSVNLISPEIFIRSMMWGMTFENSVNFAYKTEIILLKIAKLIMPGIYWANDESFTSSKPIILGASDLKFH